MNIQLINGDCLEEMAKLPESSIDLVLTDPPYGTTACKWDTVIPFEPLWAAYKRICKKNAAIVLFGSEPFSSVMRVSNPLMYRYDWVWDKVKAGNFVLGNKMPLKTHENVSVFYSNLPTYNPQKTDAVKKRSENPLTHVAVNNSQTAQTASGVVKYGTSYEQGKLLPVSIQTFSKDNYGKNILHPTQKPVALMEYLIRTYTNEGETVLDNTMGSGTTGVACKNTNRNFIGIELDKGYFDIASKRIAETIGNDTIASLQYGTKPTPY
jgi:site-specific DNA-methyltransferase (adenine-specific)